MVVCPRFVWWRWLALPVVAALAGPVAAQTAATDRLTPVPELPSLAQRIDPIVPPVERVAPSAPRLPVAVVPGVKRVRAGVAAVTPPSAANVPAPTGVQAIGSLPDPRTARKTAARPGALAPSSRSSLGRPPAAAQTIGKTAKRALARVTAAARPVSQRAQPKR